MFVDFVRCCVFKTRTKWPQINASPLQPFALVLQTVGPVRKKCIKSIQKNTMVLKNVFTILNKSLYLSCKSRIFDTEIRKTSVFTSSSKHFQQCATLQPFQLFRNLDPSRAIYWAQYRSSEKKASVCHFYTNFYNDLSNFCISCGVGISKLEPNASK